MCSLRKIWNRHMGVCGGGDLTWGGWTCRRRRIKSFHRSSWPPPSYQHSASVRSALHTFTWPRTHKDQGNRERDLQDPAAGSRHAGCGKDGRTRGSGLERILQRGGRSHTARFTAALVVTARHSDPVRIRPRIKQKFIRGESWVKFANLWEKVCEKVKFA